MIVLDRTQILRAPTTGVAPSLMLFRTIFNAVLPTKPILVTSLLCPFRLEEAVERLAHDRSFSWLRVAPLMQKVTAMPDTSAAGENNRTFWEAVDQVLSLAQLQFDTAMQVQSLAASAAAAKDTKAQQREQKRADFFEMVGCQWLCAIVKFAPNIDQLGKVLGKFHLTVLPSFIFEKKTNLHWYICLAVVVGGLLILLTRGSISMDWCAPHRSRNVEIPHCSG